MSAVTSTMRTAPISVYYVLFAVSGFAGLIYESIWSQYLKLFLGHAAYAQSLVLMIFMGGMAIGAWVCGRITHRLSNPLMWYGVIELVVGVAAILFDPGFKWMTQWVYDSLAPQLGSGLAVDMAKWSLSTAIIFPQSVLLGATFPLITAAMVRHFPDGTGRSIAWLYFTNSFGASLGILAAGFVLVKAVGLPGTILTSGLLNLLIGMTVLVLLRLPSTPPAQMVGPNSAANDSSGLPIGLLLAVAGLTGLASFMYEIAWIRMLSLVLGSATHSFELMLSAFILGLALGSFWIRSRIDAFKHPLMVLGVIQITMAVLAAATVWSYGQSFHLMEYMLGALRRTSEGYSTYVLISHLLCLLVMLPVTFCAGMTLPLLTKLLMSTRYRESGIGYIYATNTAGSILGVLLAVHVVMPWLGVRHVVGLGACVDLVLGLALVGMWLRGRPTQRLAPVGMAAAVVVTLVMWLAPSLDANMLGSGVFRSGSAHRSGEVVFARDGKTATVHVFSNPDNQAVSIATNGKVDAAMHLDGRASQDDPTMVLLGLLPLALQPEANTAAVIGFGSGRTSHALLAAEQLERVDTIEIEPAMVEGSRAFGPLVERVYTDPRSHIHLDDAKTYFARSNATYDIIISEPSNPWVSGTATLFSSEFYAHVRRYLSDDGLFVQWLQLYEIEPRLVASMLRALAEEFPDLALFAATHSDLVVIASNGPRLPNLDARLYDDPALRSLLEHIDLPSPDDLRVRYLGDRATYLPYTLNLGMPPNSDYFPIVDQSAAEQRFRQATAGVLVSHHGWSRLFADPPYHVDRLEGAHVFFKPARSMVQLQAFPELAAQTQAGQGPLPVRPVSLDPAARDQFARLLSLPALCDPASVDGLWMREFVRFLDWAAPYLQPVVIDTFRARVETGRSECGAAALPRVDAWLDLAAGFAAGDDRVTVARASRLLAADMAQLESEQSVLVHMGLAAAIRAGDADSAITFARAAGQRFDPAGTTGFLVALAAARGLLEGAVSN